MSNFGKSSLMAASTVGWRAKGHATRKRSYPGANWPPIANLQPLGDLWSRTVMSAASVCAP
jgi:hypothetical protein